MDDKISATVEDYLGAIYVLERDGEPVVGARLAELLRVTPPTVTNTLKRMLRDGLITMDSRHGPHLTQQGSDAARTIMHKHMLVELMLAKLSIPWSRVHKHAHEIEHAIQGDVESALVEAFGNPSVCPHGNPLPGHEDAVAGWIPLIQAPTGAHLTVRRIHEFAENNEDVLHFLEENHIGPGQEVTIGDVLPFNQTVKVYVAGQAVSLGFAVARYVYGEPAKI
jgi:DtxR family transcriptional regulator, Mn-dependent transcriptional regulator